MKSAGTFPNDKISQPACKEITKMSTATGYAEFGFGDGDSSVKSKGNKRFDPKELDKTYRVSFVWWPGLEEGELDMDAETPRFIGGPRSYIPKVGYILNKGSEYTKLAGDQPRMGVGTIAIVWPTKDDGTPDKARIAAGECEVLPWFFGKSKYEQMASIHREFPFGSHDLSVTCTEAQFKKLNLSPCRESLFRKFVEAGDKKAEVVEKILAQALVVASTIRDDFARDLTLDQIREKLGKDGGVSTPTDTSATTEEVDDLLDDILNLSE